MKGYRYITNKKKGNNNIINHQFFRKNMKETKRLYDPDDEYIDEQYIPFNKFKQNNNNDIYDYNYDVDTTRNYIQFKNVLNSYMNDYEKLKRQNKIPEIPENNYNFQEYQLKKNNVKEIFDSSMNLNGIDEFYDTDKIIYNLPDDYGNILLKNDTTKKDYNMRYEIITGEKLEDDEKDKENENMEYQNNKENKNNKENQNNINNNKLNENYFDENDEEEEEVENENEINNNINNGYKEMNNNINNDINKNNIEEKNNRKILVNNIQKENYIDKQNDDINNFKEIKENNMNENSNEKNLNNKENHSLNNDNEENNKIGNEKNQIEEIKEINKNNFEIKEEHKFNFISNNIKENSPKKDDNDDEINNNKVENDELNVEINPNTFKKLKESENAEILEEGEKSGDQNEKDENEEKYDDFE